MRSVDCWRLLGVPPDATAAEVRAAYLRRVRDVHPDSGGSGDGLTLSLLQEARDEAVAAIEGRGRERRRRRAGPAPVDREGSRGRRQAEAGSQPCHVCRREFPRPQLAKSRIRRDFRGRPAGGHVLLCLTCQVEIEAGYKRAANTRAVVGFLILAAMLIFAAVVATVRAG